MENLSCFQNSSEGQATNTQINFQAILVTDQPATMSVLENITASTNHTTLRAIKATKVSPQYLGYDNVHWYVGNAKQAASYYITRFGFQRIAYRGLETGSKLVASHVVRNGNVTFIFTSPLHSHKIVNSTCSPQECELLEDIQTHLRNHGDAVRDVAFQVDNVDAIYAAAIENGAHEVYSPKEMSDTFGTVKYARIKTYGDTTHTLIQRNDYNGPFLPGFRGVDDQDSIQAYLPGINLENIDHCVGNQDWNGMEDACD